MLGVFNLMYHMGTSAFSKGKSIMVTESTEVHRRQIYWRMARDIHMTITKS